MVRKAGVLRKAKSRAGKNLLARKRKKSGKSASAKIPSGRNSAPRRREKSRENPARAMMRPPPPGEGKRGEQGHLAYLLRQAQAATRLTIERALAELGVTSAQFVVLTKQLKLAETISY